MAARTKTIETAEAAADAANSRNLSHPELDDSTRQLLAKFRPVVEQRIDDVIAEFLKYVSAWPEMRLLTQSAEGIACLRREQGQHLLNLFSCQFDDGYFARVSRMGQAHEKAGLEPRWYLGAYGHVLKILVELAIEHCGDDAARLRRMRDIFAKMRMLLVNLLLVDFLREVKAAFGARNVRRDQHDRRPVAMAFINAVDEM